MLNKRQHFCENDACNPLCLCAFVLQWTTDALAWLDQVASLAQNKAVLDPTSLYNMNKTRVRGHTKLKQCINAFNEALKEHGYGYTRIAVVDNFSDIGLFEEICEEIGENLETTSTPSYLAAARATARLLAFTQKGFPLILNLQPKILTPEP